MDFNDRTERLKQDKAAAEKKAHDLRAAAGSIAHELRTPLASIKMAAQFMTKFWSTLLSSYTLAYSHHLITEEIPERSLVYLEHCTESILRSTHHANAFIELMLSNLKEDEINAVDYRVCNIANVINQCLSQYPFQEGEETLVHWDPENDFKFIGNECFMMNVVNNLIKNALYFIKDARKGEIYIWLQQGETENTLYFLDTARGASKEILAHLFENFYSKRQGGAGLGLTFCKNIMESFGGSIVASSVEGEFIQFALHFPVPKNMK